MHPLPLLTPKTRLRPTRLTHHELRPLPLRRIDLPLCEQLTAHFLRTPARVPYAVLGVLLRVAQLNRRVEVEGDAGEVDGLGAAAGGKGAAVGEAGPEAGVEALVAEDVAAGEGDGGSAGEGVVAPVA